MTRIEELLAQGLVERVRADPDGARSSVREAQKHLRSVEAIASTDPNGAFALLWDATRKAITAHMLAAGLRIKADRPGAHRAVVLYAEAAMTQLLVDHVAHFDRMRRTRNRSEYGPRTITSDEVLADLAHGAALVAVVVEQLQ
jgi:hypothetical protein